MNLRSFGSITLTFLAFIASGCADGNTNRGHGRDQVDVPKFYDAPACSVGAGAVAHFSFTNGALELPGSVQGMFYDDAHGLLFAATWAGASEADAQPTGVAIVDVASNTVVKSISTPIANGLAFDPIHHLFFVTGIPASDFSHPPIRYKTLVGSTDTLELTGEAPYFQLAADPEGGELFGIGGPDPSVIDVLDAGSLSVTRSLAAPGFSAFEGVDLTTGDLLVGDQRDHQGVDLSFHVLALDPASGALLHDGAAGRRPTTLPTQFAVTAGTPATVLGVETDAGHALAVVRDDGACLLPVHPEVSAAVDGNLLPVTVGATNRATGAPRLVTLYQGEDGRYELEVRDENLAPLGTDTIDIPDHEGCVSEAVAVRAPDVAQLAIYVAISGCPQSDAPPRPALLQRVLIH